MGAVRKLLSCLIVAYPTWGRCLGFEIADDVADQSPRKWVRRLLLDLSELPEFKLPLCFVSLLINHGVSPMKKKAEPLIGCFASC